MDPITQGTLGATYSLSSSKKNHFKEALIAGILGGMAPDLDILIQSSKDPMVYFEYHRQFTHSLFFIPFGGLIVSLFLRLFFKKIDFKRLYLYTTIGYATHGLLDACTTYGTLLLWPFSDYRFAWNTVSIIDPLYTLPLVVLIVLSFKNKNTKYARYAVAYSIMYLLLGFSVGRYVEKIGWRHAQSLGHTPLRLEAKPSFANIVLWRVIYEYEGEFFVNAIHVNGNVSKSKSIKKFSLKGDFPEIDGQHAKDIETFKWFSKDYLIIHPDDPLVIGDARYALLPGDLRPLWGIKIKPNQYDEHVSRVSTRRNIGDSFEKLLKAVFKAEL